MQKKSTNFLGLSCDSNCHTNLSEATCINPEHKDCTRIPAPHDDMTALSPRSKFSLWSGSRGYERSLCLVMLYQGIKLLCMNAVLKFEIAVNRILKGSGFLYLYPLERNK